MKRYKGEALLAFLFSLLALCFYGLSEVERGKDVLTPVYRSSVVASEMSIE